MKAHEDVAAAMQVFVDSINTLNDAVSALTDEHLALARRVNALNPIEVEDDEDEDADDGGGSPLMRAYAALADAHTFVAETHTFSEEDEQFDGEHHALSTEHMARAAGCREWVKRFRRTWS